MKLEGIDPQYVETVYQYVQKDIRPNSRLNLALYNFFNTRNGKYRTDKVKKIGEAPNLLDSALVEISRKEIEKYLVTKGFFKAKVTADMQVKNKRANITFSAERGPMFRFRNYTYVIEDTTVRSLYARYRDSFTKIHAGKRYDRDSVMYEIESIYALMKRHGYYDYLRQNAHAEVDSNFFSSQVDVKLTISNPDKEPKHHVYTLDSSLVIISDSDGEKRGNPDISVVDSQHVFTDFSKRFNTKAISNYIFLEKGDIYNSDKNNLTNNRLYDLNIFKNLKISYEKINDSTHRLNPVIEAVPLKRMSNRIEGEYTFNSGRNGFNIGNTYTNRNLLGGAEQLDVKLRYGILYDSGIDGKAFASIFNRDLQLGVNLTIPRLLVPFGIPQSNRNGVPHTTFSTSLQIFDQRNAFRNRIFINSVTYDWTETKYKLHSLTPINFEYRRGSLDPAFRQSLEEQGYQLYILTNDRKYVSLGSQYSFTLNAVRLNNYENFVYLKTTNDLAGNSIGLLSQVLNLRKLNNGDRTIFGVSYLQYAKTELDLRYYRSLGGEKQMVARINPGFGYPYANSKLGLPFEKNFYAGGSNGIRSWQARTLGPGQYNRAVIKNDTTRRNLRNLDQLGEIKIEGNIEYRFKMVDNLFGAKLKGAVFTDYGNVWRLRENAANPGGTFKFDKFLNQMAIGAGMGLRFDLDYFVFRFDVGAKLRDPQFVDPVYGEDSPWVIRHFFDQKDFKARYKATNSPDPYRFVQYNFGIGMPF
ncbi:translocation and assembly module lipoprotein TamL [Hufsiella ginkgonis]|uniref:translocation and assembly module lipoprotein TamL n=1 Tax=Hufsiella ginkgonis TaxID=2695274 RepID=UPI0034E25EAB